MNRSNVCDRIRSILASDGERMGADLEQLLADITTFDGVPGVAARDAALDASQQQRITELLAERTRIVAAFDEARANAPCALTDALADITRIAGERDQARRQVATLQATVLGLLAVVERVRSALAGAAGSLGDAANLLAVESATTIERIGWSTDMRMQMETLHAVLGKEPRDA